jgi:hypothetical protein
VGVVQFDHCSFEGIAPVGIRRILPVTGDENRCEVSLRKRRSIIFGQESEEATPVTIGKTREDVTPIDFFETLERRRGVY